MNLVEVKVNLSISEMMIIKWICQVLITSQIYSFPPTKDLDVYWEVNWRSDETREKFTGKDIYCSCVTQCPNHNCVSHLDRRTSLF